MLNHDERLRRSQPRSPRRATSLSRGTAFPLARGCPKAEGDLHIHAEAMPPARWHGPIALIDEAVPVIVLAPPDDLFKRRSAMSRRSWRAAAVS